MSEVRVPYVKELTVIPTSDPRKDLESRTPNLGPYTTKGSRTGTPIKGSTFWILLGSGTA